MSNNIKRKLQENIVAPTADSRSSVTLTGVVTKVNEKYNNCSVKFNNVYGTEETKHSIPVYLYNKSIIDWFPEIGDNVLLQYRNGVLYITGPAYNSSYDDFRQEIALSQDVYAESFINGMGGYVF